LPAGDHHRRPRFVAELIPMASFATHRTALLHRRSRGLSLIELMISMAISLILLVALVSIYVNVARSNDELSKTNNLIENGRFALQILESDLVHAGFWGGYLPQFDDLTHGTVPGDAPAAVPDPCLPYANWTASHQIDLIGTAVQSSDNLWAGAGCVSPAALRAGSDVLVVRHAETCVPGSPNCDAYDADRLYFQHSLCTPERSAGAVAAATPNTVSFAAGSATDGAYEGVMMRTLTGTGAGQLRLITAYDGGARLATVDPVWAVTPDATTTFALDYSLGTSAASLHNRDCVGTGTPAGLPVTAGTVAELRRFISNIYYISDRPHPVNAGLMVPTLMRAQFDSDGGTLAHRSPVPLIDGVEAMRIEIGVDDVSETGEPVDFTTAISWLDAATMAEPRNRGDGVPDRYIRCTAAAPCSAADLANAVSVKLWVLARSREPTASYVDEKSYCLGAATAGGCPADAEIAAANDNFKRHVFSRTIRLVNVSARRETPFL
jgi:prepilin-type N-terminal cleavage/methylation domain-containing protein